MTNIKFGECLSLLLSALDINMNQLSKAINVDSSLVSRWVSGKRIPAYNTVYIESITEYLSKNIKNSFQEQHVNRIFFSISKSNELNISIQEKIQKILLESQGYSIECKKEEQRGKKNQPINKEQISSFLNMDQHYPNKQDNINDFNYTVNLSSEDKIIFGIENIVSAGTSLLEATTSQLCKDDNVIYITYNNSSITNNYCHKLIHWRNALLKAISNGWKVVFLLRLDNNINRIISFINFIYPVLITGKLNLYYFNKYDISTTCRETYVVSDIGALSCFPMNTYSEINCSFYLKNKSGVDIFKNYFNSLLINHAQPLIKYYSKNIEYHRYLVEFEENIGNRFQYKYCFSMFTLTENLFKKLLIRKKLPKDEMLIALDIHKRKFDAFLSNIQNYQYKDIYSADSIKALIKHRQFHFDYYTGTEIMDLEVNDIIEILQNVVNLLKKYDNFSIAFMPQNTNNFFKNVDLYCAVKERQSIVLETFNPSKDMSKIQLSIEEHMVIKTLDEYFKQIWQQIAPVNKDKNEIITMLQNQIDILKK